MGTLVMKFGGAAVESPEQFSQIADIILMRSLNFSRIAVVISAMGNTTDSLIALAKRVNPDPPRREMDMLMTVGERISVSLLAMALALKKKDAISFTGSQSGIITSSRHNDARIIDVRPSRLVPHLDAGKIVIVAGFQGVSKCGEITTLGRGGSDTTAVALAIALEAMRVEFYKDVAGIYAADPKIEPDAPLYSALTYPEALKIAEDGAKILHPRCIKLASKNNISLHVLSFRDPSKTFCGGTVIQASNFCHRISHCYEEE